MKSNSFSKLPERFKKLARSPENKIAAEQMFGLYSEYIIAGFTKTEALDLIHTAVHAAVTAQFKNGL